MLIVFEGLDGVGKSTLARSVAESIGAELLSSPGTLSPATRAELEAYYEGHPEARQLFYLSTVLKVSGQARALLEAGRHVVIDRYVLSTLSYAEAKGSRLELEPWLRSALLRPDLTFFVDLGEAERRARLGGRADNTTEDEWSLRQGERVRAAYRRFASDPLAGKAVWLSVDGMDQPSSLEAALRRLPCQQPASIGV